MCVCVRKIHDHTHRYTHRYTHTHTCTHTHTHNADTRTKKTTARFSVGRSVCVCRKRERREGAERKVNLISAIVLLADH